MTETNAASNALLVRYTVEELTVLADLYDLPAIPGCPPSSLTHATRGLATRCLIARQVVAMPEAGGLVVQQPHATLIGTIFGANDIVQTIRHRSDQVDVEQWFITDESTVQVTELDGIVTMVLHHGAVRPGPPDGPTIDDGDSAVDETISVHREGDEVTVDRLVMSASGWPAPE